MTTEEKPAWAEQLVPGTDRLRKKAPMAHPFDEMTCPAADCDMAGTVPGMKRHVKKAHPELIEGGYEFPPLRAAEPERQRRPRKVKVENLDALTTTQLRGKAKAAGIKGWHTMDPKKLLTALKELSS